MLLGPIVNAAAIVICSLVGRFILRGIPGRYEDIVTKAIGLCVIYVGISGALVSNRVIILILSLVLGSMLGELIDIDRGMNKLGTWAETKMGFKEGNFSKGFVNASILFCTGSMAIIGAMESGLSGDHSMLYVKGILDGFISIVFAASMGIGVAFSAIPVLLYEGGIALGVNLLKDYMTPEIISEMSAAGSLIIAAIGFNFIVDKQIKVANMIPAIFLPWLFIEISSLIPF